MQNMVRPFFLFLFFFFFHKLSSNLTKLTDPPKGPVIRVNPDEVYINDPEFIEEVYAGPTKKREKYETLAKSSNRQSIARARIW